MRSSAALGVVLALASCSPPAAVTPAAPVRPSWGCQPAEPMLACLRRGRETDPEAFAEEMRACLRCALKELRP